MIEKRQIGIFIFFALAGFTRCTTGAGEGSITGTVNLPECGLITDQFDLKINFFAADYFENTLTIRLQKAGGDQNFSDGVVLVVRDVEFIADSPSESRHELRVEPTLDSFKDSGPDAGIPQTTWNSPARATLYLNATCPNSFLGFADGAGWIRFDNIYVPEKMKRIRGEFELEFIDPRHWESAENFGPQALLQGEFDFNYTRGKPAQTFP